MPPLLLQNRIFDLVPQGSSVVDIGCGDGRLLRDLVQKKSISPLGLEIDIHRLEECVAHGVPVLQMDIDHGLSLFEDHRFDIAILRYTLSEVRHPLLVFKEMLRVAKSAIIIFSNFAHWQIRWSLLTHGKMPVSQEFPYEWYNTPNIHFLSIEDILQMCKAEGAQILHQEYDSPSVIERTVCQWGLANFAAKTALFHVSGH